MTFSERLKELRSAAGLSQEKLAEIVGVSRQAVTKWETAGGIPDMDNLIALARVFRLSLDALMLGADAQEQPRRDYLYESVTDYDVSGLKRYDIRLGSAQAISLSAYEGEKLHIRLASDTIASLPADYKIKLDDTRGRLDVDVIRQNGASQAAARDGLFVFISLPEKYLAHVEAAANATELRIENMAAPTLEFDGKVSQVYIDGFSGGLSINCSQDMDIRCGALAGHMEINQRAAVSRLILLQSLAFAAKKKGVGNAIRFTAGGKETDDFSDPTADTTIELNGMGSELVICRGEA